MPPPVWLIEGLFERDSLIMLAGPPGSFKSFMLIDWMLCMASGRKWMNRPTQMGKVVYALGEGKSSLFKRITAWIKYNELSEEELRRLKENFKVTFEVPQLASKASTDNFLAELVKEEFRPDIIAIDTFARGAVGLDENDAKDTGVWIDAADRVRQELKCAIIFLHHTKKNMEFGVQYRGSSAILGAMDTGMTLERKEDMATLKVTKQKDHDEGKPLKFQKVMIGAGADSMVLAPFASSISINMDEEEGDLTIMSPEQVATLTAALVADETFLNDTERAEVLASESGMTLNAARVRVSRLRPKRTKTNYTPNYT